jgi:hypothetical protein
MHKPPKTKLTTTSTHQGHAFTANDFIFYNKNGHVLKKIDDSSFILAASVQITWRIQKTRQNGHKIKLSADTKTLQYAPSGEHCEWS